MSNIQAGCMDCSVASSHTTVTEATAALKTHVAVWDGHRPLIADNNGWHRAWILPYQHAPRRPES